MQFLNITSWIIGFIGLVLTAWTMFRQRNVKRVVIGHRSVDAAAAIPENSLQPTYVFDDGIILTKVYFSYFYIHNNGTRTVNAEDFRKEFTVKMSGSPDVRVLRWSVSGGRQSAGLKVSKREDAAEWTVTWSHLDPGQAIRIESYTDAFVESVTSDGDFSYEMKVVDADKHWNRQHAAIMAAMIFAVSTFFLWRPIYYMLNTGKIIDLNEDRWEYIPSFLLVMLLFWLVTSALSWLLGQSKPGPRYIPPPV